LRSASLPISLAIPEFDAANSALVSRQINWPCITTIPDSIPNSDIGIFAILEMHNNSLELNVAALNKKPDRSESPAGIHTNDVMIASAIYTRISEAFPSIFVPVTSIISTTPLGISSETEAQQKRQHTEKTN
jgi:hypothetical protein